MGTVVLSRRARAQARKEDEAENSQRRKSMVERGKSLLRRMTRTEVDVQPKSKVAPAPRETAETRGDAKKAPLPTAALPSPANAEALATGPSQLKAAATKKHHHFIRNP